MAKKKSLTHEEELQNQRARALSFYEREKNNLSKPTYRFSIGDEVKFGNIKNCIIKEVLDDGLGYGFTGIHTNNNYGNPYDVEEYYIASWVRIRPKYKFITPDSNFKQIDDIDLHFNNSTIESLFSHYYGFGIDMNPYYQRDYVWDDFDNEALLDSIFENVDIGKFVLFRNDYSEEKGYEIGDGKQRLNALISYYENRYPYRGYFYNDLSPYDQYAIKNKNISMAIVDDATEKQKLKIFLKINTTGKVMDKEHLNKVSKILEDISNGKEKNSDNHKLQ